MKKILITLFLGMLLFPKITFGQTGQLIRIIENGKYGYINEKGEVKIKPQFSNANDFWNGIKTTIIYSNEIDANINISQFWLQDYWLPGDILDFFDPY